MGRSLWNLIRFGAEGFLLCGLTVIGMTILLPLMQVHQTLKGNPLWFWPRFDKARKP